MTFEINTRSFLILLVILDKLIGIEIFINHILGKNSKII